MNAYVNDKEQDSELLALIERAKSLAARGNHAGSVRVLLEADARACYLFMPLAGLRTRIGATIASQSKLARAADALAP